MTSLETQAVSAATGNLAGNVDPAMAEERLAQVPEYVQRFRQVFGVRRPTFELAMKAIATFERALTSSDSPFDREMRGERAALSEAALRGKELFEGKAACIQCHNGALFSDEGYHALGVPEHPLFTAGTRSIPGPTGARVTSRSMTHRRASVNGSAPTSIATAAWTARSTTWP